MSRIAAAAVAALAAGPLAAASAAEPVPRAAVVVGANAPVPGRAELRHAHRDAEAIAEVLATVGRFPRERVHVLRDPSPADLLALLDREAAALAGKKEGMLFFYFSGHADRAALFSGGRPVHIDALRRALDRPDVGVRIGVIDACQGGGWTRAKGLVPDAPFEVPIPRLLESEGSALLSSSSGDESAHESDLLGGSFFTVHLAAGLRGAADESGDGEVTLNEAFEYARQRTIRDTARQAKEPQHPSFALNLRGRQDLVLAQVAASPSALAMEQEGGPIELVHLATGLRLLELPPGPRQVRLAVPPGRYLVRKSARDGLWSKEVAVPRDGSAAVKEHDLVLVGSERIAVKGVRDPRGTPSSLAMGDWRIAFGLGGTDMHSWAVQVGAPGTGATAWLDGRVGLTDRWTWRVGMAAFAYRLGSPDGWELVPFAGLLSVHAPADGGMGARFGGGAALRRGALLVTAGYAAVSRPTWADATARRASDHHVAVGLTTRWGEADVALALGTFGQAAWVGGTPTTTSRLTTRTDWKLGSIQEVGLEPLPLVRWHFGPRWTFDLYAALGVTSADASTSGYLAVAVGTSARF